MWIRFIATLACLVLLAASLGPASSNCSTPQIDRMFYGAILQTPGQCHNGTCGSDLDGVSPLSAGFGGSFWAVGFGDPAIGQGIDNGTYAPLSYYGWVRTAFDAGQIYGSWSPYDFPGAIDGCIDDAGASTALSGDECMEILVTDQTVKMDFAATAGSNAGTDPQALVVDDFDADGRPDLAVANQGSDDVSVLLGNGDGTFQTPTGFSVGVGPRSLVTGDFDENGVVDLVAGNSASNDVSVLIGNADGTFQPELRLGAGIGPSAGVVGDFNHDMHQDLAVANTVSGDVTVLLGDGLGGFLPGPALFVDTSPVSLAVAQINGDEYLDLIVLRVSAVASFVGDGTGKFTFRSSVPVTFGHHLAVADVDRDGEVDIVYTSWFGYDFVVIRRGNGDGSFSSSDFLQPGRRPEWVAVDDLNHDGHLDIVAANRTSEDLLLALGRGDGTFESLDRFGSLSLPEAVALADLNGDSRVDVVAVDASGVRPFLNGDVPVSTGFFAALTDQVDLQAFFLFQFAPGMATADLAPIPPPDVEDAAALRVSIDPLQLAPGSYLDASCGGGAIGYRVYQQIRPPGQRPDFDRSIDGPWNDPTPIAPVNQDTFVNAPPQCSGQDLYLATSLILPDGYETPVVSADVRVGCCGEVGNDRCDLDDGRIFGYFASKQRLEWEREAGFDSWNIYRGDLDVLRTQGSYTQAPGSNPIAGRTCGISDPTFWVDDLESPPSGTVAFYLITGQTGPLEGDLGLDSGEQPRVNGAPCPPSG